MKKIDVVVIDDDAGIRWVLDQLLLNEGIASVSVASGLEGLQMLKLHQPRLAIIDLKLGGMNGLEVAQRLDSVSPNTQIIFLSGYTNVIKGHTADLPVKHIFDKPFDVRELIGAVNLTLQH